MTKARATSSGSEVSTHSTPLVIDAGGTTSSSATHEIDKPALWDLATPHLYTLETRISDGDRTVDLRQERATLEDVFLSLTEEEQE